MDKHEHLACEEFVSGLVIWKSQFNRAASDTILQFKYLLADFLRTSVFVNKYAKGNVLVLKSAIEEAKKLLKKKDEESISLSTIYDLLAVSQKFPTEQDLITAISRKGLPIRWGSALILIGRKGDAKEVKFSECNHLCPQHCAKTLPNA